jgi:hypothetical protein
MTMPFAGVAARAGVLAAAMGVASVTAAAMTLNMGFKAASTFWKVVGSRNAQTTSIKNGIIVSVHYAYM